MTSSIVPIIMAGGSGTRLWPLSRTTYPKQFLALNSDLTLLQETLARLSGLNERKPIIVCNEEHRFIVAEQLRQQQFKADILLEPVGRNTAPAITLAALQVIQDSPQQPPVLLILPSDHAINDTKAFQQAIVSLIPQAQTGRFATLGIQPTQPEIGYGYIRMGREIQNQVYQVLEFSEKPDTAIAQSYVDNGDYLWNSGIYVVRADRYIEEIRRYEPQMLAACEQAILGKSIDMDFIRLDTEAFARCPNKSIDYAIMEPLSSQSDDQVVVTSLDAGWSDVGSWSALWEIAPKDSQGNAVIVGEKLIPEDVVLQDSHNCLISAHSKLVTLLGTQNLVIVDTDDALLVADRSCVQGIKDIIATLKSVDRSEHHTHRVVYRPWGKYDSIDVGNRYQVKRITVMPGAKLSLQMHYHRTEHWIVVSGTAKVSNGEKTFLVTENQSTYIPMGTMHRLENPGSIPLEIIEIQLGSYLGEDDIIRFNDSYNRA